MPRKLDSLSYAAAQRMMNGKSEKRFSSNSKLVKLEVTTKGLFEHMNEHKNVIGLRLHGTIVALWFENGFTAINSGGYHTNTTKRYIGATGISVTQKDYAWYVWQGKDENGKANLIPFHDGMIFDTYGKLLECDTVAKIVEVG